MNIKKLVSGLLAAGTIAFSSPLAFADWTNIDVETKMINFEKRLNKHNWCWLSSSLKLIEYWTNKYKKEKIEENYQKTLEKMTSTKVSQENFETFLKILNSILMILQAKYSNDYHNFSRNSCLYCDEDDTCNSMVAIKGIEYFLNHYYVNKKFYSFEINIASKISEILDKDWKINSKYIENPNAFDIVSKIITENKCPLLAALPISRTKKYSVKEIVKSIETHSKPYALSLRFYFISGIDSQKGLIRLVNPSPRKSSEAVTEISKDEFNKYCFSLSGVLDKEFSL